MSFDAKIKELEKMAKQIETEKSFDTTLELFNKSAEVIKGALKEMQEGKGKVLEVVKELDQLLEKEIEV